MRVYNSKVKEERLEDALTAAKARLAELEIGAAKLREAAEWSKLADMLDPPKNIRPETLPLCETQATQVSNAAPAAKLTERSQSSKAAPAAEPDEAACAASSVPDSERCDRCGMMNAIADVSLSGNCFYETDESFKCDL